MDEKLRKRLSRQARKLTEKLRRLEFYHWKRGNYKESARYCRANERAMKRLARRGY